MGVTIIKQSTGGGGSLTPQQTADIASIANKADQTAVDAIHADNATQTELAAVIANINDDEVLKSWVRNPDSSITLTYRNVGTNAERVENISALGGVTSFIALTDTPNALTGLALQILRVNAAETALEAQNLAASIVSFDNSTANLAGAPAEVKTAIEALKALIDAQPLQTTFADIASRPDPGTVASGSIVHINDASADLSVTSGWAKYQEIGGVWFKYISQEELGAAAIALPDTTIRSTDPNYSQQGTVSVESLDQYAISRRSRRIFDTTASIDLTTHPLISLYPERTAMFIRNKNTANGINITHGKTNVIGTYANGKDISGNPANINIQPGEIACVEIDGNDFYISIFPAERVLAFSNYASANAFGAMPHDSIVIIRDTSEIFARKTGTNAVIFPLDGQPNTDWFKVGDQASTSAEYRFTYTQRFQGVAGTNTFAMTPPNGATLIQNFIGGEDAAITNFANGNISLDSTSNPFNTNIVGNDVTTTQNLIDDDINIQVGILVSHEDFSSWSAAEKLTVSDATGAQFEGDAKFIVLNQSQNLDDLLYGEDYTLINTRQTNTINLTSNEPFRNSKELQLISGAAPYTYTLPPRTMITIAKRVGGVYVLDESKQYQNAFNDPATVYINTIYYLRYAADGDFTLPTIVGKNKGDFIEYITDRAGTITVKPQTGEQLNGVADGTFKIYGAYQTGKIVFDGTTWIVEDEREVVYHADNTTAYQWSKLNIYPQGTDLDAIPTPAIEANKEALIGTLDVAGTGYVLYRHYVANAAGDAVFNRSGDEVTSTYTGLQVQTWTGNQPANGGAGNDLDLGFDYTTADRLIVYFKRSSDDSGLGHIEHVDPKKIPLGAGAFGDYYSNIYHTYTPGPNNNTFHVAVTNESVAHYIYKVEAIYNAANGFVIPTATQLATARKLVVTSPTATPDIDIVEEQAARFFVNVTPGKQLVLGAVTNANIVLVSPIDGLITAQATGANPTVTFTEVDAIVNVGDIVFSDVFNAVASGSNITMSFTPQFAGNYDFVISCGYQTVSNYGMSVGTTSGGTQIFDGSGDRLFFGPKKYSLTLPAQEIFITLWGGGSAPGRNIDCRVVKR